jgi:hypothetical protein
MTSFFFSCKKEAKEVDEPISESVLSQIKAHGFNNKNVVKIPEGYLVEGDIILTSEDLAAPTPGTPNMIIAREEHYRTFNLVNTTKYATIKVALNNSSSQHQAAFSTALDEAIARYNAENLLVNFQRVTSGKADISVTAYYQISPVLGSAGFPSSRGVPYKEVKMNTYWYQTNTSATNVNYIATVMAHEIGHCIGYRHTDYMNRAYSCGSGGSEGGGTDGAVHIPGTPTVPDADSWMLACIGDFVNRPFTSNDKVALSTVY